MKNVFQVYRVTKQHINLCSKRLRFHQFSLHPTMQHLAGTWKDQHVKGQR